MKLRKIGNTEVPEIGLGCMNLSHGYGGYPSKEDSFALLQRAYDLGALHFDTAALYGFGRNEELVGEWMQPYRKKIHLASKCGMQGVDGKRVIDGRAATLKATLEDSLRRLDTDFIDVYYLHRWDKNNVAIEESVGAMAEMVQEGKIGGIGLSEVSAATLRKAHAVHPITAVQNEYSLWTRNPEIGLSEACQELGVTLVAFSPLGRGFLCAPELGLSKFVEGDMRLTMPRFQEPHVSQNRELIKKLSEICTEAGCSLAQISLAWLLAQGGLRSDDPGPCDAICRTCTPARSVARQSRLLDELSANIRIQLLGGSYARCSGRECTATDSGRGSDGHARSRGNGLAG